MSEEEKQWIKALLKCCRRQAAEYECDQKDWADHNKAMQEEKDSKRWRKVASGWKLNLDRPAKEKHQQVP